MGPRTFERFGPWWENLKLRLQEVGGVLAEIDYDADLYRSETIEALGDEYLAVLDGRC